MGFKFESSFTYYSNFINEPKDVLYKSFFNNLFEITFEYFMSAVHYFFTIAEKLYTPKNDSHKILHFSFQILGRV